MLRLKRKEINDVEQKKRRRFSRLAAMMTNFNKCIGRDLLQCKGVNTCKRTIPQGTESTRDCLMMLKVRIHLKNKENISKEKEWILYKK